MEGFQNKRRQKRFDYAVPVFFSSFHASENNKETEHVGHSVNFSESGLCIETDRSMAVGASLYVRMKTDSSITDDNGQSLCRTASLAEVRWCRELESSNDPGFHMGMQYLHPAI